MPQQPLCAICRQPCNQRRILDSWYSQCHTAGLIWPTTQPSTSSSSSISASPPSLPIKSTLPRLPPPKKSKELEKYAEELSQEFRQAIVTSLEDIGMDAKEMAVRLKEAMDICKEKKLMGVYARLLELWGEWMKIGGKDGTKFQGNTFNFGLDQTERQRVLGVIGVLEEEGKRRGLSGFLPGDSQAKDAAPLQRVVDIGGGEETITDRGAS